MGFSSLIVMLGMTLGPIIVGILADRTGSYSTGLAALALAAMLGSVFFIFATKPLHRRAAVVTEAPLRETRAGL